LSENISAVDWFTKRRINDKINPEQCGNLLDELIEEIIQVFNNKPSMEYIADGISDILERNPLMGDISSDLRLPVCSLLHHLKNTSGIAVCLVLQEIDGTSNYISSCLEEYGIISDYKEQDLIALVRIASLLHDVGKPRSYTFDSKDQRYHHHTQHTIEIIDHILSETTSSLVETMELRKILPQLASRHNGRDDNTKLEKIISNANTVASAADRIYDVKGTFEDDIITVKCNDRIFPHEIDFNAGDLRCHDTPTVVFGCDSEETRTVEMKNCGEKSVQLFVDNTVHGGPVLDFSNDALHIPKKIGILSLDMMGIQGFISEAEKLKMLRGGSVIVDEALKSATNIISKEVCKEAVLFAGGGNMLSFVPNTGPRMDNLVKKIETEIKKRSNKGLNAALVTFEASLDKIGGEFGEILGNSQNQLEIKKNKTHKGLILSNTKPVCKYCFKREKLDKFKMCEVCNIKNETGDEKKFETFEEYMPDTHGLKRPAELNHIGNSIAVIIIDGNMMGRMFQQTNTPAEYTCKSQTFSTKFEGIIISTIKDFLDDTNNLKLVKHNNERVDYLGIDVLYVGGDDVLIIMNAKGAVRFSEMLVNNVAEEFTFEMKFHDGTTFKNPIVTISCGIAIADSKFPIYFLLNAAREMESRAKEHFRDKTKTDDFGIILIPKGAIAVTAISSAMPSNEYSSFVLTDEESTGNRSLFHLNNMINFALNKDRTLTSDIITCGTSEHERLNLIKFMYSSIHRKTSDVDLDDCEWMAEVLLNNELLKASQMIIPHLWHDSEEELI